MVDVIGRAKVIVEGDVDQSNLSSVGGKIGSVLKTGALVGVAALGTLAAAGIKAGLAFEEAAAVSRKLGNVLENMGVGDAADEVEKLAASLSKATGIDDEVIKGGQTILATFTQVAQTAGQVGGAFERASALALDMSAVFGSVDGASRALGRALESPEKAATLLRRANVLLTEEQQNLIDGFLASGDAAAAQDVILDALEDRYKGTAEEGARASERLKTGFGEVQEAFGGLISDLFDIPGEKSLMDVAADATFELAEAVEDFQDSKSWKNMKKDIKDFGEDLGTVANAFLRIVDAMDKAAIAVSGDEKKGLLYWMLKVGKAVNPFTHLANQIELVGDQIERVQRTINRTKSDGILGTIVSAFTGGITTNADGGRVLTSGLSLVGEEGPELVNLRGGSYVHTAAETQKLLTPTAAGGDGDTFVYAPRIYGPTSGSMLMAEWDWSTRFRSQYGRSA